MDKLAWDDTKVTDDLIKSSDWNAMVTDQKSRLSSMSVAAGEKIYLNGNGGNTYLILNGSKVELWVNGVKKADWG